VKTTIRQLKRLIREVTFEESSNIYVELLHAAMEALDVWWMPEGSFDRGKAYKRLGKAVKAVEDFQMEFDVENDNATPDLTEAYHQTLSTVEPKLYPFDDPDQEETFRDWIEDVNAQGLNSYDEQDARSAFRLGWSPEEYAERELADERDLNR
jgi:hypothetical protein